VSDSDGEERELAEEEAKEKMVFVETPESIAARESEQVARIERRAARKLKKARGVEKRGALAVAVGLLDAVMEEACTTAAVVAIEAAPPIVPKVVFNSKVDLSMFMRKKMVALAAQAKDRLKHLPMRVVSNFADLEAHMEKNCREEVDEDGRTVYVDKCGRKTYKGDDAFVLLHGYEIFVDPAVDIELPEEVATVCWATELLLSAIIEEMLGEIVSGETAGSLNPNIFNLGYACLDFFDWLPEVDKVWMSLAHEVVAEHLGMLRKAVIKPKLRILTHYSDVRNNRFKMALGVKSSSRRRSIELGDDETDAETTQLLEGSLSVQGLLKHYDFVADFDKQRYLSIYKDHVGEMRDDVPTDTEMRQITLVALLQRLVHMSNDTLGDADMEYILDLFHLADTNAAISLENYFVVAAIAEHLAFVNRVVPKSVAESGATKALNKPKAAGVETERLKAMWALNSPDASGRISLETLEISMKAGRMDEEASARILNHFRNDLKWESLDFIAFISYMPLFKEMHSSITESPLEDQPRNIAAVVSNVGAAKRMFKKWKEIVEKKKET